MEKKAPKPAAPLKPELLTPATLPTYCGQEIIKGRVPICVLAFSDRLVDLQELFNKFNNDAVLFFYINAYEEGKSHDSATLWLQSLNAALEPATTAITENDLLVMRAKLKGGNVTQTKFTTFRAGVDEGDDSTQQRNTIGFESFLSRVLAGDERMQISTNFPVLPAVKEE